MKDFEKDFSKLLNNAFFGKTSDNVRNRRKVLSIEKGDNEKKIERQSKLTFNGIIKSYTKNDSYNFKQNDVSMDNPNYLGFAIIEMSKILSYET